MEKDDGTNMAHTLWRKYDGLSGRWTSPDPYGGSMTIADPQSFNRYTYVNNDPVNQVDLSGLMGSTTIPSRVDAGYSWSDMSDWWYGGEADRSRAFWNSFGGGGGKQQNKKKKPQRKKDKSRKGNSGTDRKTVGGGVIENPIVVGGEVVKPENESAATPDQPCEDDEVRLMDSIAQKFGGHFDRVNWQWVIPEGTSYDDVIQTLNDFGFEKFTGVNKKDHPWGTNWQAKIEGNWYHLIVQGVWWGKVKIESHFERFKPNSVTDHGVDWFRGTDKAMRRLPCPQIGPPH